MSKLAFVAVVVGASFVVACSGGAGSDESASQAQQAMCPINSDTCIGPGGLPKPTRTPKPVGTCDDKPANTSYAQFGNATATPINGWSTAGDSVHAYQSYLVQQGLVSPNDQPYFIAPNGSTGYAWIGFQLGPQDGYTDYNKYSRAYSDGTIASYHNVFPVLAHVVSCTYTYYDAANDVTQSSTTYWLVNDPGACSKSNCVGASSFPGY